MLVAYRGRLVLEEYFFGHDRDTPHDTRSAGKTFASVMLGAAMMQRHRDLAGHAASTGDARRHRARSPIPTRARSGSRSPI